MKLRLLHMTEFQGPSVFDGGAGQDKLSAVSYVHPSVPAADIQFFNFEEVSALSGSF